MVDRAWSGERVGGPSTGRDAPSRAPRSALTLHPRPGMRRLLAALLLALPVQLSAQGTANGVALFEARRYAEARTTLEAAAKADPKDARAAYYLGRIALVD